MANIKEKLKSKGNIDPHLKEQDEAIFEAFARADYQVLTAKEIGEYVDLGDRQVRRRLHDLADREVVGTRKPGRDRLWWLEQDVKEPITVQYPLLRFVRDRSSIQLLLIGLGIATVAMILIMSALISFAYNVSPIIVSQDKLLRLGLYASMFAGGFLIASVSSAAVGWLFRNLGITLRPPNDDT